MLAANQAQYQVQSTTQSPREIIGNYILTKTIGTGSIGQVKLAVNTATKHKFAIKILPRQSCGSAMTPEAFSIYSTKTTTKEIRIIREAALSTLLHHACICSMHEMLVDRQNYYLVFEYVSGGQLLDYIICHGRLRESVARKFARQIGSALDYCHANNVVHRNLRLEDILISETGDIKIIDFGLANLYDAVGQLSTFCGSSYFVAPEVLNAQAYIGPELDVWSFGVILYVLVCGRVPFDDVSLSTLHDKIRRGSVTYPRWLSRECKRLLSRMLATYPATRASLAEVLAHPWTVRGFNGPPTADLAQREVLRAKDIDQKVIRDMSKLEFGSEADIIRRLTAVLESDAYNHAIDAWQRQREQHMPPSSHSPQGMTSKLSMLLSDFGFRRRTLPVTYTSSLDPRSRLTADLPRCEPSDPTRGFHPLVSIYHLTREKRERDAIDLDGNSETDMDMGEKEEAKEDLPLRQATSIHAFTHLSDIRHSLTLRWRLLLCRLRSRDIKPKTYDLL